MKTHKQSVALDGEPFVDNPPATERTVVEVDMEPEMPVSQEKPLSGLNRIGQSWNGAIRRLTSKLRLSLVLRVALYAAGQLIRTTIPMLLAVQLALGLAQLPGINRSVALVAAQEPADGTAYAAQQLMGTPFTEVHLHTETFESGIQTVAKSAALLFSDFTQEDGSHTLLIYRNTLHGGAVFHYPADVLMHTSKVLLWTLLCFDLLRIVYFLRHRNRLNKKVLKPITDMAETAATLGANNLSERINVEGTKNELKDLALVINGMLDRIELSYNSQKQFVSDASHELRTPIAVIQGYVSMLKRWGKTDPEVLDEGINAIAQESTSMKELVERLLFLARHDKKTLMLEMEDFNPLEVVSELHREAKMLSDQHEFCLNVTGGCTLHADKGMIKQLMRILLDNAIKYTPAGGKITIGMKCEENTCTLSVQDTGEGIAAKDMTKIFDRFYRCDEARKSQTSGHGLGLSIARIIAVAHGGKINVRSKVGVGTTFSVKLPVQNMETE
ncbi:MAG: HAMP domain-containing histidine kinase [Clostridia bacterium]|nr:HAMP domain-containing histidine kinase [Clostridia bacterium]